MPRLRNVSGKACVKILCNKFDFKIARRKGSHVVLKKETSDGMIGTVVLDHKEIKVPTLHNVLKLAKIDESDFEKYL